MKSIFLFLALSCFNLGAAQDSTATKTIHIFVALCDNANQGIVPVPAKLGNGQDAKSNLYWGALYGVKTYFKNSKDWILVSTETNPLKIILERVLFKHKNSNTYLLADAYDGQFIKQTIIDFLEATAGRNEITVKNNDQVLKFGGQSNLLAYVGHDGLMEFEVEGNFSPLNNEKRDAILLACISKRFFRPYIEMTKANPLVWTTGLMAPEAYTMKSAIDGWIADETDAQIAERAANAYHSYQKCGLKAAKGLLVTGF